MKKMMLLCLLASQLIQAQTDSTSVSRKPKKYIATITTVSRDYGKGLFYEMNDSAMILQQEIKKGRSVKNELKTYRPEVIRSVNIKRKNSALKGMLIGAGAGLVTGAILGFAGGDDPVYSYPEYENDPLGLGAMLVALNNAFAMTAGEKAILGGVSGMFGGALAGVIIGSLVKKKFIIHGKKERFQEMKLSIMEMAYNVKK